MTSSTIVLMGYAALTSLVVYGRSIDVDDTFEDSTGLAWYGDPRQFGAAQFMNGPVYDLNYDDELCASSELVSAAVPNYMYMGAMLRAMAVHSNVECRHECLLDPECQAVNYYRPHRRGGHVRRAIRPSKQAMCELLEQTQWYEPRWMRPLTGAVYYDHIACQSGPEDETATMPKRQENSQKADFLKRLKSQLDAKSWKLF